MLEELKQRGYALFPGALGENLTRRGLDFRRLRPGDLLRAVEVPLEITTPRAPCSALNVYGTSIKSAIYDERVKALDAASPLWGMSGLYASVVEPGPVREGNEIALLPRG